MIQPKVKLISGLLYPDEKFLNWSIEKLKNLWGEPEIISKPVPFNKTNYYDYISPNLTRIFLSFPDLRDPADLVD